MSTPLISVIIPTYGRPQFLPIAVRSALDGMSDEVEVIVVPNGPDESWKRSLAPFALDKRVRIEWVATANANVARNHGMALARGKYLRFLDDDDFLYPAASVHQYELLESSGADICSGAVELVDADCRPFRIWDQPETKDFVKSILVPQRVTHVAAHVFRTTALIKQYWDESISLGQDTHWMHQLCQYREWTWVKAEKKVGAWRHHPGPRVSAASRLAKHLKLSAQYLSKTIHALIAFKRLGEQRQIAAAAGMWHFVHNGFFMEPTYWTPILREILKLFPETYPDVALYRNTWGKTIPPLLLESLMLPKRRINHGIRLWKFKRGQITFAVPP